MAYEEDEFPVGYDFAGMTFIPRRPLYDDPAHSPGYFESDRDYMENNRVIAVHLLDTFGYHPPTWADCCRASNRLADLVCLMYHPKGEQARKTWPTTTWAEIIASELGIEIPGQEDQRLQIRNDSAHAGNRGEEMSTCKCCPKCNERPGKTRAIRNVNAAIAILDEAADNLPIDSTIRRKIITNRQNLEDLLVEMERV